MRFLRPHAPQRLGRSLEWIGAGDRILAEVESISPYYAASARFSPPTPIRRTWPSQPSCARLVMITALEE